MRRISLPIASTMVCTLFMLVTIWIGYGLGVKIINETSDFIKKISDERSGSGNLIREAHDRLHSLLDFLPPALAERVLSRSGHHYPAERNA